MVAALNKLTTVLNATSPLILPNQDDTALSQNLSVSVLKPPGISQSGANIAYSYAPPGNIALLARPGDSVLLTQEALQKPVVLQSSGTSKPQFSHKDDFTTSISSSKSGPGYSAPKTYSPSDSGSSGAKFTAFDFKNASGAFSQADALAPAKTASDSFSVSI